MYVHSRITRNNDLWISNGDPLPISVTRHSHNFREHSKRQNSLRRASYAQWPGPSPLLQSDASSIPVKMTSYPILPIPDPHGPSSSHRIALPFRPMPAILLPFDTVNRTMPIKSQSRGDPVRTYVRRSASLDDFLYRERPLDVSLANRARNVVQCCFS